MIKNKVETIQYSLEERDIKTIIDALHYAQHRITKHPECGAKVMSLVEIERLLVEFLGVKENLLGIRRFC